MTFESSHDAIVYENLNIKNKDLKAMIAYSLCDILLKKKHLKPLVEKHFQ